MFELGTIIGGKYCLEQQVGEGGMASIWRAVHMDLDRPVAVKFVNAVGPRARSLVERFMREARVAASVRHRNVVDILDFGKTDDGHPYMVMELLHGQDLADHLGEGLQIAELVRLVADALLGLAAVHEAGIVHRDIKPENIFLNEEPEGLCPKLLDFGISRGSSSTHTGTKAVTLDGAFVGTPQYMSPEQARGLKGIDSRADIYGMGVVLYEGLTGRVPFESEAVGDLIIQVTTGVAPTVVSLHPELGQPLSAVVERAMAREPGARFPDARSMRQALLEAAEEADGLSAGWGTVRTTRRQQPHPHSHVTTVDPPMDELADLRAETASARPGRGRLWLLLAAIVLATAGATVGLRLMADDGVGTVNATTGAERETADPDPSSEVATPNDDPLIEEPPAPEPAATTAPVRAPRARTAGGASETAAEGAVPSEADPETDDVPTEDTAASGEPPAAEGSGRVQRPTGGPATRTTMTTDPSGPFEDPGF